MPELAYETDAEQVEPLDDRYDTDATVWQDSHRDAAEAWINFKYPTAKRSEFPAGTLLSTRSAIFRQYRDGSGEVILTHDESEYYDDPPETLAWRFADGGVLIDTTVSPNLRRAYAGSGLRHAARNGTDRDVAYEEVPLDFVEEVIDQETELDGESFLDAAVTMHQNRPEGRLDIEDTDSPGVMIEHKSGHRVYVGRDRSAHRDHRIFAFVLDPDWEAPSAVDAIDLLKPDIVEVAENDGRDVRRHGEWWLVPNGGPQGTVQKPGVGSRPFGASPLANHVPREWATAVEDDVFLDRFAEAAGHYFDEEPETPQAAVRLVDEAAEDETVPITFHDIRTLADGVYVKGSIRHRNNEHFFETFEDWNRAYTHDKQVYTADREYQDIRVD